MDKFIHSGKLTPLLLFGLIDCGSLLFFTMLLAQLGLMRVHNWLGGFSKCSGKCLASTVQFTPNSICRLFGEFSNFLVVQFLISHE